MGGVWVVYGWCMLSRPSRCAQPSGRSSKRFCCATAGAAALSWDKFISAEVSVEISVEMM